MLPCTGIVNLCPPFCKLRELKDGTYTITNVLEFHIAMDELIEEKNKNAS